MAAIVSPEQNEVLALEPAFVEHHSRFALHKGFLGHSLWDALRSGS